PPRLGRKRRRQRCQRRGGVALDLKGRRTRFCGCRHCAVEEESAQPAHAPGQELAAGIRFEAATIQERRVDVSHGSYRVSAASILSSAVAAAAIPFLISSWRKTARSFGVRSRVSTQRAPKSRALST